MTCMRLETLSESTGLGLFELHDAVTSSLAHKGGEVLKEFFDILGDDDDDERTHLMNNMYAATKPTAKVFRRIGVENLGQRDKREDHKRMVDLNRKKLAAVGTAGSSTIKDVLSSISEKATTYMTDVIEHAENTLVPAVLTELDDRFGLDLSKFHQAKHLDYRFLDYPEHTVNSGALRCGDHIDVSTISIILQCGGDAGLEVEDGRGNWKAMSSDKVVVMLGSVGQILSNDRLQAPWHRVADGNFHENGLVPRRNSVVIFVSADPHVPLEPHVAIGDVPKFQAGLPLIGSLKPQLYKGLAVIDDFRVDLGSTNKCQGSHPGAADHEDQGQGHVVT